MPFLPLLLLGGLAALVLSSKPTTAPAPQSYAPVPNPANPYLPPIGVSPMPTGLNMQPVGPVSPYLAQASISGYMTPMGYVGALQRVAGYITSNGYVPGEPAVDGTVHTGCSCAQTGAPVVVDRFGRSYLMVYGWDF